MTRTVPTIQKYNLFADKSYLLHLFFLWKYHHRPSIEESPDRRGWTPQKPPLGTLMAPEQQWREQHRHLEWNTWWKKMEKNAVDKHKRHLERPQVEYRNKYIWKRTCFTNHKFFNFVPRVTLISSFLLCWVLSHHYILRSTAFALPVCMLYLA